MLNYKIDTKELELPDTVFVRDIENRVFQTIVLECLSKIKDISLLEENFIDHLFHRNKHGTDRIKGIYIEQESKNHSINIKVELNINYGTNIPNKANEVQTKISQEISDLTGLHVSRVHVIFKNLNLINENEEEKKLIKTSSPE